MTPIEALQKIAESDHQQVTSWKLIAIATEAIKKWEDSSGKETGINIFSDAIEKIKVITETYSHLGTMKRDILHEVGRLQSVAPYRAFDKISRNIKPENKEIVDKEVAAINKSKEELDKEELAKKVFPKWMNLNPHDWHNLKGGFMEGLKYNLESKEEAGMKEETGKEDDIIVLKKETTGNLNIWPSDHEK